MLKGTAEPKTACLPHGSLGFQGKEQEEKERNRGGETGRGEGKGEGQNRIIKNFGESVLFVCLFLTQSFSV